MSDSNKKDLVEIADEIFVEGHGKSGNEFFQFVSNKLQEGGHNPEDFSLRKKLGELIKALKEQVT